MEKSNLEYIPMRKILERQFWILHNASNIGGVDRAACSKEMARINRELNKPYVYLVTVGAVFCLTVMSVAVKKRMVQPNYISRSEEKKKNWW